MWRSVPQTEAACTRTRISPSPGSGMGTSTSSAPGPGRTLRSACIVADIVSRVPQLGRDNGREQLEELGQPADHRAVPIIPRCLWHKPRPGTNWSLGGVEGRTMTSRRLLSMPTRALAVSLVTLSLLAAGCGRLTEAGNGGIDHPTGPAPRSADGCRRGIRGAGLRAATDPHLVLVRRRSGDHRGTADRDLPGACPPEHPGPDHHRGGHPGHP